MIGTGIIDKSVALRLPALLLAAVLLLAGCAGSGERPSLAAGSPGFPAGNQSGTGGPPATANSSPWGGPPWWGGRLCPPSASQLESILQSELTRLGKSVSDTTPKTPTGATNFAFDLSAAVVDLDGPPDGEGGGTLPPTGITLAWTERLQGDYDENGQVNAADLAPLGMNWQRSVAYDDAALHGGIAFWPTGAVFDDGGSVYPAAPANGSGAQNWRRARVDGKEDGLLNAQDVMPIAAHWYEQSAGYRVYARLPGETEFSVLPNPDDIGSLVTIPRAKAYPVGKTSADTTRPVSFSFTKTADGGHSGPPHGDETAALPEGRYEFYAAAYDSASVAEGPSSPHLVLDITGGVANQPPVAQLSVSPGFAGAPAVITFDASQSADPDGSIAEYRWDFDADGVIDWSTADASVPAQSSGGTVDTITPGEAPGSGLPPSTVTATYRQGYDHYLYPRVTVVDDKGGTCMEPRRLGISGWVNEVLSSQRDAFNPPGEEITTHLTDISIDPNTGELCFIGVSFNSNADWGPPWEDGIYFIRRHADGQWDKELACTNNDPFFRPNAVFRLFNYLVWQSNGQPAVVINEDNDAQTNGRVLLAARQPSGAWEYSLILESPIAYGVTANQLVQTVPGEYYVKLSSCTGKSTPGGSQAAHQYIAYYLEPGFEIWDTGWDTEIESTGLGKLSLDPTCQPVFALPTGGDTKHELWIRRRAVDGTWSNERLDTGLPVLDNRSTIAGSVAERTDGVLGIAAMRFWYTSPSDWRIQWCCAIGMPQELTIVPIRDYCNDDQYEVEIRSTPMGFSLFTTDQPAHTPQHVGLHHDLVDDQGQVTNELIFEVDSENQPSYVNQPYAVIDAAGQIYIQVRVSGGEFTESIGPGLGAPSAMQLLCTRVDPRIS